MPNFGLLAHFLPSAQASRPDIQKSNRTLHSWRFSFRFSPATFPTRRLFLILFLARKRLGLRSLPQVTLPILPPPGSSFPLGPLWPLRLISPPAPHPPTAHRSPAAAIVQPVIHPQLRPVTDQMVHHHDAQRPNPRPIVKLLFPWRASRLRPTLIARAGDRRLCLRRLSDRTPPAPVSAFRDQRLTVPRALRQVHPIRLHDHRAKPHQFR